MSISISMVALGNGAQLSPPAIQAAWRKARPDAPALSDPDQGEATLAFRAGDADVIYGLMPAPIPWSDLEGPCNASWLWPEAATEMQAHEQHVIVTVTMEGDSPVDRLKVLTQATAALASSSDATVGVYWCDSQVVMTPQMFGDFAELLPGGLPLFIWVNFQVGQQGEKTAGFTRGLAALNHLELETDNSPEPPGELRERLYSLADYLVTNGPVIKNGHTIGEDAEERIKVTYADSSFGHESQVMRLDYEHAETSTGRSGLTPYGYFHLLLTFLITMSGAWLIFSLLGGWIASVILRLIILVIPTLVAGFVFLVLSDRVLQALFGLQAFYDSEDEDED